MALEMCVSKGERVWCDDSPSNTDYCRGKAQERKPDSHPLPTRYAWQRVAGLVLRHQYLLFLLPIMITLGNASVLNSRVSSSYKGGQEIAL